MILVYHFIVVSPVGIPKLEFGKRGKVKKGTEHFKKKCRSNSCKIKENTMPREERVGFKVDCSLFP